VLFVSCLFLFIFLTQWLAYFLVCTSYRADYKKGRFQGSKEQYLASRSLYRTPKFWLFENYKLRFLEWVVFFASFLLGVWFLVGFWESVYGT